MGPTLILLGQLLARTATQLAVSLATSLGVTAIVNLLKPEQGGSTWVQVSNEVGTSLSEIENGSYGLAALAALVATARTDILAAIGTPQQAGVAVTLPGTAPSGYGGLDAGATGDAVWNYHIDGTITPAGSALDFAYNLLILTRFNGEAVKVRNTERMYAYDGWEAGGDSLSSIPLLVDRSDTIQQTDASIGAWLERVNPGFHTSGNAAGYEQWIDIGTSIKVYEQMSDVEFAYLRSLAFNVGQLATPPLWPGLDGVTLGSVVPFSGDFTVATNMEGIIVTITSVPPNTSFFDFDGVTSWRFLGAIAFRDDNNQYEAPQNLGFSSAVYLPKTLGFATAVVGRVKPGVIGTVQTFSIP